MSRAKIELIKFSGDPAKYQEWLTVAESLIQAEELDLAKVQKEVKTPSSQTFTDAEKKTTSATAGVIKASLRSGAMTHAQGTTGLCDLLRALANAYNSQSSAHRLSALRELIFGKYSEKTHGTVANFFKIKENLWQSRLQGSVTDDEIGIAATALQLPDSWNPVATPLLQNKPTFTAIKAALVSHGNLLQMQGSSNDEVNKIEALNVVAEPDAQNANSSSSGKKKKKSGNSGDTAASSSSVKALAAQEVQKAMKKGNQKGKKGKGKGYNQKGGWKQYQPYYNPHQQQHWDFTPQQKGAPQQQYQQQKGGVPSTPQW